MPGRASATTPARAISMPAPAPWWRAMAGAFPTREAALRDLAGHRRLHRGGDRGDRLRPPGDAGRRQCRARGGAALRRDDAAARRQAGAAPPRGDADAGRARRRLRAGGDGSGRHDLHAEEAEMRALPVARGVPRARARASPRACRRGAPKRRSRCGAASPSGRCGRDGAVLLRRRPEKGLLGGMMEVPSTAWRERAVERGRGARRRRRSRRKWRRLPGVVRHSFTHFHLELAVLAGEVRAGCSKGDGCGCGSTRSAITRCRA